ncbi:hypothetical protein EON82_19945 [bacterium]|nr:MAG: hypothetical protein EON82_19945 [bacterium]
MPIPFDAASERFARAAMTLYGEEREFEIRIPEGHDEVAVAAAFRAEGCDTTYLTQRRTIIVVTRERKRA